MGGESEYREELRALDKLFLVTILAVIINVALYAVVLIAYTKSLMLYITLDPSNVMTKIHMLEIYFRILAMVCIIYGAVQLMVPYSLYLMRKWTKAETIYILGLILLYVIALVLLAIGGMRILRELPTFLEKCRTSSEIYENDHQAARNYLWEAKGDFSSRALLFIQVSFWLYFPTYIISMWFVADGEAGRRMYIGFLCIGAGHLFLVILILGFNVLPVIGYLIWLDGMNRLRKRIVKIYRKKSSVRRSI